MTSTTRKRAARALALVASGGLLAAGLTGLGTSANAADPEPALKLRAPKGAVTAYGDGQWAFTSLPVLVQAVGGDLDLRVKRDVPTDKVPGAPGSYDAPVTVTRMVDGTPVPLPGAEVAEYWGGLADFWTVTVSNTKRDLASDDKVTFCPNTYEPQRIDPDSVDRNQYPSFCYGQTFTLGARYGLSEGWGAGATEYGAIAFPGKIGKTYTVKIEVNDAYRALFGTNDTSLTAQVTVKKPPRGEGFKAAAERATEAGRKSIGTTGRSATAPKPTVAPRRAPASVPTVADPDPSWLPDLKSLPSAGISTSRKNGVQYLNFGATVWVDGNSRLDIEGFRDRDDDPTTPNVDESDLMTAYQYFYDGDQVMGKQPVGTLQYHRGGGHNHWHLDYFATYELVKNPTDESGQKSEKQSFCLAPTDPVDLTVDGADFLAEQQDLGSSCGSQDAQWIRETLPLGWGDTYTQQKGGQAFNMKGVSPGVWYIRITANPTVDDHHQVRGARHAGAATEGALFETDKTNNVSYRKIVVTKRADGRKLVCVPAVDGLGAEGYGVRADGTCKEPAVG